MWIKAEERDGEKAQIFNLDHALRISVMEGREPVAEDANEPNVHGVHRATGPHTYTVSAHFVGSTQDVLLTRPKSSKEEAEAVLHLILQHTSGNIDLNEPVGTSQAH
jgi:hypothetical protein